MIKNLKIIIYIQYNEIQSKIKCFLLLPIIVIFISSFFRNSQKSLTENPFLSNIEKVVKGNWETSILNMLTCWKFLSQTLSDNFLPLYFARFLLLSCKILLKCLDFYWEAIEILCKSFKKPF